jgi:hypothetical protein
MLAAKSRFTKTLPPPWMGGPDAGAEPSPAQAPIPLSAPPPLPRVARTELAYAPTVPELPRAALVDPVRPRPNERGPVEVPPLFGPAGGAAVTRHRSGMVEVQIREPAPDPIRPPPRDEVSRAFAGRLDAVRVVAGGVSTRVLHRRVRDADTAEVMGGIGSPLVRFGGEARLVLGPRSGHELVTLAVTDGIAFVREDLLAGFELALQYENGRVALDPAPAEGAAVVQLRGTGSFVVEVAGELASLPSSPGKPLVARRDWIVGWFGRLVSRALTSTEAPAGHRGLVGFWGEGTVLVCVA